MLKLYEHIEDSIITELKKYAKQDSVPITTITNFSGDRTQPDYPYISVGIVNMGKHIGADPNNSVGTLPIQILVTSDDKWQAFDIGHWICHIFFKRQPLMDMLHKHVIPQRSITPIDLKRSFLPTHFEYINGATFTFGYHDPIDDDTQPGYIAHIHGSMNDSPLNANRED